VLPHRPNAILLLAVLVCAPSGGQDAPTAAPPVREFIVKFQAASEGERVTLRAAQDQAAQSALFADFATVLSGEIGMPVRIYTVTSGRELVLGVDAAKVADSAVAGLQQRPDVVRAMRVDGGDTPGVLPRDPVVAVEFAEDSAIGRRLAEAWPSVSEQDVLDLSGDMTSRTGMPLTLRPEAPAITFTLDMGKVASDLEQRLKRRPDVAYVEPNRLLQPLAQ
jgi:hypothetical protein